MTGLDQLFGGLRTSGRGLAAERIRIDVISENIANARTTRTADGGPYRRKVVEFEPLIRRAEGGQRMAEGVQVSQIVRDYETPFERMREPGHPDADADGMVAYPNVNAVMEMADMITALRAYDANVSVQESFVRMAERALQILR